MENLESTIYHDIRTLHSQLEMGAHRGQIISMIKKRVSQDNPNVNIEDVVKFVDTNYAPGQINSALDNLVSKKG